MPVTDVYTVIGDGNVRRNMTTMNIASRPSMGTARVSDCVALPLFSEALVNVSAETTVCVVQPISSFLASSVDTGSILSTIDPVMTEFSIQLRRFCAARSALQVIVAPPMYRHTPVWYRNGLPQVIILFPFTSLIYDSDCSIDLAHK